MIDWYQLSSVNIFHCIISYEKMISGKYLGEIVRLALKDLICSGALCGGKSSTKLDTFEAFGTKYLSAIEGGYVMWMQREICLLPCAHTEFDVRFLISCLSGDLYIYSAKVKHK